MTGIKLIADSGATKTEWRLVGKTKSKSFFTSGISPYYMTQTQIEALLLKELPKSVFQKKIDEVFYYGTGCKTKAKAAVVRKALANLFSKSKIPDSFLFLTLLEEKVVQFFFGCCFGIQR